MKDFPVFTTENGVASLVLKEIPYRRCAYIILRDSLEPEALLAECISFCRACGAERVFAARLLMEGNTYSQVIAQADISSATLSRVSRCVQYGKGYSRLLKKEK